MTVALPHADGHRSVVTRPEAWVGATNPVLPGFHPDPSVCRVDGSQGCWFYLVTSTFEYLPGLPVHRSRDLVTWQLVGHVITDQLDYAGLGDSGGLYAPTIRHDGERFLVVCELVGGPEGATGTFVTTATDAAGPWSEPIWWPDATGGDASLLLDGGRIWAHAARQTQRQDWVGQGEVWVREVDPATLRLTGPETVVFTSAVVGGIWTEGPHLYRRGEHVHLVAAEGGTGRHHAVVVGRAASPTDVFEVGASNPVLTHRNLGPDAAVVNVGHADLVEAADGSWWTLVLASRLVDGVDLLGRETFLAPVTWVDDAPVLAPGVGTLVPEPGGPDGVARTASSSVPDESWVAVRRLPAEVLVTGGSGRDERLVLRAGDPLDAHLPAFVGQRLGAPSSAVTLELPTAPGGGVVEVGLALRQSGRQWLTVGLVTGPDGSELVVTRCVAGVRDEAARVPVAGAGAVRLTVRGRDAEVAWLAAGEGAEAPGTAVVSLDVAHLSTTHADGFVGVVVGAYAVGSGETTVGQLHQRATA
ncbi:glycoside hydrolase family 43 protein [Serinibacter arcticus]|uniref:Beta-xylosidase n=1 Tax=Serinibacter arcticus TaxID=1655435 RepID=A0A4Z1E240_9MICO|nr:glycoside hydrolase family 43 protein [Serinibacter arcticus]TGO03887.1 Beta-xylosidase [Serinibacter arcticus]